MAELSSARYSSSGVSDQQSVGSSPDLDTQARHSTIIALYSGLDVFKQLFVPSESNYFGYGYGYNDNIATAIARVISSDTAFL